MNLLFSIYVAKYTESFYVTLWWIFKDFQRQAIFVTFLYIWHDFLISVSILWMHMHCFFITKHWYTRESQSDFSLTLSFITHVLELRAKDHVSVDFWSIVSILWDLYYVTHLFVELVHLRLLYFEECILTLYFTFASTIHRYWFFSI
jgi:hypothetical protein